ncbi:Long chronological lifespan protein 2 [Vanrija albida]|uniref:Long chronological lifespan protein 2 n=1 Tax=Vanrija albida TaxID=181172 RepID=A0ABR3Q2J1_9TREE
MTRLVLLALALLLPLQVAAQFGNFFQQAFHGGGFGQQRQEQQQQQQQRGPQREHKGWNELHAVSCRAGYVCPGSLTEDIKCVLPDDRPRDEGEGPPFLCVRGDSSCDEAVRYARGI